MNPVDFAGFPFRREAKRRGREIAGLRVRAEDVARRGPGGQRRKPIQNGAASHWNRSKPTRKWRRPAIAGQGELIRRAPYHSGGATPSLRRQSLSRRRRLSG